jgi:hypothetical protein
MAVLTDPDRAAIAAQMNRDISSAREPLACVRADIRATVDALDTFLNANATAINNAIPAGPRAALTSAQKARILAAVIKQRYGAGA